MIAEQRVVSIALSLVVVLCLLWGCEPSPPFSTVEYTDRLARVLKQQPERVTGGTVIAPEYPRQRDLQIVLEQQQIDLLDFLALGDCDLQQVVAHGNSSLGRVATASGRLIADLAFLGAVDDCIDRLAEDQPDLATTLKQALAVKKQQLNARIFLAVPGGPEMRAFWRNTAGLDAESLLALSRVRADIERWQSGDFHVQAVELEARLGALGGSGAAGLLREWAYLLETLPPATAVLNDRLARRPLCFPGMKPSEADIFRRVVMDFFIADIQVKAARLNRLTHEVLTESQRLEALLMDVETAAFRDWREARDALVEDARAAINAHVQALEPLMQQCGFLPQG